MNLNRANNIADFEVAGGIWKGDFEITPISKAGIKAMEKYRGLRTKKMILPIALFDGFQEFCSMRGANVFLITPDEETGT